jgi:hypothetical protein
MFTDVNIKEWKMAISFHLHSELHVLMDTVQVVKKLISMLDHVVR